MSSACGPQVWAKVAPLLEGAPGLKVTVVETTRAGHAKDLLAAMPQEELPQVEQRVAPAPTRGG